MIAILDTNIFINRNVTDEYSKVLITNYILAEIKDEETRNYYQFQSYKVEIKNPSDFYFEIVRKLNEDKNLLLSMADISVVALTLEMHEERFNKWISREDEEIICLSEDNGIKQALACLNLTKNDSEKKWKFRCSTCFTIYNNERDFCEECGYATVTRVSYHEVDGKIYVHLKKNYKNKEKVIKDRKGNRIMNEHQKEYKVYIRDKEREQKEYKKMMSRGI